MSGADETVSATIRISASPEAVFAVLADPSRHSDIDGTGRVRDSVDSERLTGAGQIFRVAMYHEKHPDGDYEMANLVLEFEEPRLISWKPGYVSSATGELKFGGWVWRYHLTQLGPDETEVTLSYDWSGVGPGPRRYLHFPPFAADHLDNSLRHLAELVVAD
ncbi:MAG TPA: SRPBCC family protein [Nocardioidaceae bacterium]|nr:SRPBCC family protein [Nocardioidaceae bacterium]